MSRPGLDGSWAVSTPHGEAHSARSHSGTPLSAEEGKVWLGTRGPTDPQQRREAGEEPRARVPRTAEQAGRRPGPSHPRVAPPGMFGYVWRHYRESHWLAGVLLAS